MQSHELLREVFQKCSPKQVAAELGLSLSMIYKWAEPGDPAAGSGSTNPLDRIDALIHCTNDRAPRPMDLPAGRRVLHPQPQDHQPAPVLPDPRHQ